MSLLSFIRNLWNTPPRHSIKHRDVKGVQWRKYDGARRGRLNADWQAYGTSANSEVYGSLATLRNRSRDLLRNNDYARGMIRNIVDNVVYTGINFQAQVKQLKGNKNDEGINNAIESAWCEWGCAEYCDVTGHSSFGEIQQLAFKSFLESGEVFLRKIRSSFGGSDIPFALEMIEADQVAEDYNSTYLGNQIVMGVEIDRWKRPVAYWVYDYHPGDFWFGTNPLGGGSTGERPFAPTSNSRNLRRIDASEIIHIFLKERPGQVRGVPILYSTITRLRNLGEYETSELVAARAAAAIMGLVTTPDADLLAEPELKEDNDADNQLPPDEKLAPGMMRYLAPGESFEGFAPNRPNSAFSGFFESQLRGSGAGVGVSYENVSNDFSKSNYSSSRLSLLQSRDRWKILQIWFISIFLRKVYADWLDMAVLGGKLDFKDYELRPQRYLEIRWTPRGWSWVDPHKEINATIAAIKAGLTTLTAEVAKQGGDFEENVKILAREREILERYEINLTLENYPAIDEVKS